MLFSCSCTGVVEAAKNVAMAGLTNRSEGMIVVPHANRIDFWLITHQNGSQNYSATLIDATATFPTTITSGIGLPISVANFSYHPANRKNCGITTRSKYRCLDYQLSMMLPGVFSPIVTIFNSATASTTNQSIYDIEWDPKGRYLYLIPPW